MSGRFKKSLLLCPAKYSLAGPLEDTLNIFSEKVFVRDNRIVSDRLDTVIHTQIFRAPYRLRNSWETRFLKKINSGFIKYFEELKPDMVLVYNNEYLIPETCKLIKKSAKLIFFMGDSPFYTTGNNNYLSVLKYADLILSPDTFWTQQLNTIGLNLVKYFVPGLNSEQYFEIERDKVDKNIPECQVFYSGMSYVNSWGYKKALFMNQFAGYDLKIYGSKHWRKWFGDFPGLKGKFIESGYIPVEQLNAMMNRSKIIPVDGNPGILNGFHLRLIEALGAGSLPVVEYRRDVEQEFFKDCAVMVPLVRDYNKAAGIAGYYLNHENERKEIVRELKNHIIQKYSPEKNAERILDWLSGN